MAIYRQWLGHPVERVNQHEQILNGWHFFSAEPEYIRQAAVRERDGLVLTNVPSDAWRQLMKVHTAHELAPVVRFLSGKVTLAQPSGPPGSGSVVQPPSITRMADGTLHLRVWLASPPNFQPWVKEIVVPQTSASK